MVLKGDKINERTIGFLQAMKSLKNQLFIGEWVTNIGQAVNCGFDCLAIVMNREGSLLEKFELFLKLDGMTVFVICQKRCKILPEVRSGGRFR